MKEEIITVVQKVKIKYNCEEAKQKCIEKIKQGTAWYAFSEGEICDERLKYGGAKLPDIEVRE